MTSDDHTDGAGADGVDDVDDVDDVDGAPELSPAEEARVHDLLASLPDPEVPGDVEAWIAAALATGPATSGPASTTVLAARPPSGRWRHPRLLQAAAAVVVVALIGAVTIGTVGALSRDGGGSATTTGDAVSIDGAGPITASGRTYSPATLPVQVESLLGGSSPGAAAPQEATAGGPDLAAVTALVGNSATRQTCIDALAGTGGVQQVAIDVGVWNGKPAAVIVLPNENNPDQVDVWVVGRTCSDADNPFPYQYARVTRP